MTHLNLTHVAQLAASAIAEPVIAARGYQSIDRGAIQAVRYLTGGTYSEELLKKVLHHGALAFPVYRLGNATPHAWVLRPDLPRRGDDGKPIEYKYPRGFSNIFDLLPLYHCALNDPTIPIWLTEGAKKADALPSAY